MLALKGDLQGLVVRGNIEIHGYGETAEIVVARVVGSLYLRLDAPIVALEAHQDPAKLGVADVPLSQIGGEVEEGSPSLADVRHSEAAQQPAAG